MFKFLTAVEGTDQPTQIIDQDKLNAIERIFDFDFGLPEQLQVFVNKCIEVVAVFIVLLILCKIVDLVTRSIRKRLTKRGVEKTIVQVIYYLSNKIVKFLLFLMAIGILGIDTSSLVGLITAAGLGVSLAVQGTLANFAGGILILFLRPFRVDDYIECQGTSGTVEDIRIFYTHLRTPDNKVVLIPNGALIGGNVINYSTKPTRRVDLTFDIDYSEDFKKSEQLILDICSKHELILKDPAPTCRIAAWKESSIQLSCRVWVNNADYWTVTFDLLETVYDEMNKAGIKIPYNQVEISYRNALIQKEQETGQQ